MITMTERRKKPGVAIVSSRSCIKWRYESAGIPNRRLPVQLGNTWPELRPPLVLDTIGLPVHVLIDLLANPPKVEKEQPQEDMLLAFESRINKLRDKPREKPQFVPIIALVASHDWRTLRLLRLCPMVQLVCADDPEKFRRWLPHLDSIMLTRSGIPLDGWLVEPAPELKLDPLLLPALAALPSSSSIHAAAEQCDVSDSTMARMLRLTKAILGLPPGDVSRFHPGELAALILDRLGADSPMSERHV